MVSSIVRVFNLVSVAALAALSGTAPMNAAQQATFHLTVPAHWGSTLLQPGDYKVFLPNLLTGEPEMRVMGAQKSVFEIPMATDVQEESEHSHLTLAYVNGEYFVKDFLSGPQGKSYKFAVPKAKTAEQWAQNRKSDISVAVN